MVKVDEFFEWLRTTRYTGPVTYGLQATVWSVDSDDVDRWMRDIQRNPRGVQQLIDQGYCTHFKEAAAYLKYLEQAARMYTTYY
jgi:hypothetical protein